MLKDLLSRGIFLVNCTPKYHVNSMAYVGDFITVKNEFFDIFQKDIFLRLKKRIIKYHPPKFLYVSYSFMFALFMSKPRLKQLKFPSRYIDVFVGTEYYLPRV